MAAHPLPKSVVIIGAGAGGLFAARRLRQLGVKDITLIEKESVVGGKCSTYSDPHQPTLKAERGAGVIAPNYGEVIDALKEKGIKIEPTLTSKSDSLEAIDLKGLNFFQKTKMVFQSIKEILRFNHAVKTYRKCCRGMLPLPPDLEMPFAEFAAKNELIHIKIALKFFVEGFGYGDMRDCPTYSVLEYMGYMTLPFLAAQRIGMTSCELAGIEGGFQSLMLRLAEDFRVITSANVHSIIRQEGQTTVSYTQGNTDLCTLKADALVLAVSPKQWTCFFKNSDLAPIEQQCIDHLTYYTYPVVICRLKGFPLNYIYRPQMLYKENIGHVTFISTFDKRENPPEGRLCSVYINHLLIHRHHSSDVKAAVDLDFMKNELLSLPEITDVNIIECKIWDDYFSSLPWQTRLELEQQQYANNTRTFYIGSYTLGSFEDVACIANKATEIINRAFDKPSSPLSNFKNDLIRFFTFLNIRNN